MSLTCLDPFDLPRLSLDQMRSGSAEGVWLENGLEPRQFTRRAPSFIDDPGGCLAAFPHMVDCRITSPPVFAVALDRVTVAGYRTVLTSDHRFLNDDYVLAGKRQAYLDRLTGADAFANEETGIRRQGDAFCLDPMARETIPIEGRTIVLCSHEPSNYGSWLFRILPKLATLERLRLDEPVRMLAWTPNGTFTESLALLGIGTGRLVPHDPARLFALERAVVVSLRNNQAYLDPESRALFARMRDAFGPVPPHPGRGKRLYVARYKPGQTPNNGRVMLNEAALIERLLRLGFEVVYPGAVDFRTQLATFAAAELVVGASGSAMFNTVFCRPGTRVIDIESEPHWVHAHMCLFSSCALDYGIFIGQVDEGDASPVHRRWTVDIDALAKRIDRFAPRSIWNRAMHWRR